MNNYYKNEFIALPEDVSLKVDRSRYSFFLQVVEISEVEKVQDPGFRSNSAVPPRGGLARGLSLSSPNVSGDPDLLDRIRGLERQIQIQQVFRCQSLEN